MKCILLAFCLTIGAFTGKAQQTIKLEDVAKHIGDSVIVTGKVVSGRYLHQAEGAPTFLNVGAPYPNQLLTLVIFGKDRKRFTYFPLDNAFTGKNITVAGKIELFKGKPQIAIYSDAQILAPKLTEEEVSIEQ